MLALPVNVRTRIPQAGYWLGTVGVRADRPNNPLRIFPALGCYIAGYIGGGGTGRAQPLAGDERLDCFSQAACVQLCGPGVHRTGALLGCAQVTTRDAHRFVRERGLPSGSDHAPGDARPKILGFQDHLGTPFRGTGPLSEPWGPGEGRDPPPRTARPGGAIPAATGGTPCGSSARSAASGS